MPKTSPYADMSPMFLYVEYDLERENAVDGVRVWVDVRSDIKLSREEVLS
jgi:hypothetical protein